MGTIKIEMDRFELLNFLKGCACGSHLTQGCWQRAVSEFYALMDNEDRNFLYHYAMRDLWDIMVTDNGSPRCGEDDFKRFLCRFKPNNSFTIRVSDGKHTEVVYDAYNYAGIYWVDWNRMIPADFIKDLKVDATRKLLYDEAYAHLKEELKGREQLLNS